ncbi:MAG TPA: hypothetical protein VHE35_13220 [Kofleriaceae bacterium]|nr:hypothetical protein [Kofleriaceae bacterium]
MKSLRSLIPILGIAAASLVGVASCGDNSVSCGDGTHVGTGDQAGMCVPDATCGPGTQEDPGTGKCVPDGSVICPQGTTFEDGQCQVNEDACAEGTVLVDGHCVPEDDTLTADLDEAAEPNDDPATPAGMFTVGAVDSSTVIHGCINPRSDDDGDGNLDPDYDLWVVNATGPTTLEITADGVHGLDAGFVMVSVDPALNGTLANWRRFGINLSGDTAQRQVYLPAAGSYAILVTDARTLFLNSGAAGSETACYYTTVKHIATPAATALTIPQTAAQDRGQVKLYSYNPATTGRILDITLNSDSAAMSPAFLTLRGAQNALYGSSRFDAASGFPAFFDVGGLNQGETVTLVSDMEYDYALTPQDYTYDLFEIAGQPLPMNGQTVTVTKQNGQTPNAPYVDLNYFYFDVAAANTIVNFNVTASQDEEDLPLNMFLLRRDIFTPDGTFDAVAVIDAGEGRIGGFSNEFVRFAQPGRYYFVVQDPFGTSGETYDLTGSYATVSTSPVTLGTPLANQALPATKSAFHTLDLTNPVWLQFGVTGTNFPAGATTARLSFYDLAGSGWITTQVADSLSGEPDNLNPAFTLNENADGSTPKGRILAHDTHDYLVQVQAVGTPGANPTYSLNFANRDAYNFQTIVAGTPIMRTGMDNVTGQVGSAPGKKRFIVFGTAGSDLTAQVTPLNALANIAIQRVNADESTTGNSLVDAGLVGAAETLTATFGASPNDWVAFEVQDKTVGVDTNLTLNLNAVMPRPYVSTMGAIAYADACPPAGTPVGMAVNGSTLLGTDLDDDRIPARSLPAGWNFSYFGAPVTKYIIGANGWIKMGGDNIVNDTCSFGAYSNLAIPANDCMNGVVAPFWNDYDTITLCEKVEATKVTIQWVGKHYLSTPTVSFQAIFNMNGVIDFVYGGGAAHTSDGSLQTIGLENLGGTFGHQYSFNTAIVTANTSRVMTPAP